MSGNRGNLRMTSARHSVVQGHLRCLTVHFHLYFSGGQVSRGVVLNFPALLKSPDRLTNPVYSTAAPTLWRSVAPWGRAGAGPVLLLGMCRVEVHPSYEEHNFSPGSVSWSCVPAPFCRGLNCLQDSGMSENAQAFVLGGYVL